jgi:hypothetical protein
MFSYSTGYYVSPPVDQYLKFKNRCSLLVIEEGTVERQVKVLIKYLAIFFLFPSKKFLPISFKIQLLETSPQKQKEQRQRQLDVSFYIAKFVFLLPRLQRLKLEWQKSPAGTRQTYGKNKVWFGEIERKLAKLLLLAVLPLNYFMGLVLEALKFSKYERCGPFAAAPISPLTLNNAS